MLFIAWFTVFAGRKTQYEEATYLAVRLDTAENLKQGALVYVLGVPRGYVHSLQYIRIDKDGHVIPANNSSRIPADQFVMAILSLEKNLIFYGNYSIITKYMEILGEKTVEIQPGRGVNSKRLNVLTFPEEMVLHIASGKDDLIFPDGTVLLESRNYDDPLYLASAILAENSRSVRKITRDLAEITDHINQGNGNLAAVLNEDKLMLSVVETLHAAGGLLTEFQQASEALREADSMINFAAEVISWLIGI